jgi:hypothetical protein
MKKLSCVLTLILTVPLHCSAQIWADSPKILPSDLPTQMIIFLKFDSVEISKNSLDSYRKKWSYHNAHITEANKKLREIAAMYPYKYKIVSMTDTAAYRTHGAKYVLWLNSFDVFTGFNSYRRDWRTGDAPSVEFGIYDLTSKNQYLIGINVSSADTYRYNRFMPRFYRRVEEQFDVKIR